MHLGLLIPAAVTNSATWDETAHLPAGCVYWRYGDFSLYNLSPPLARLWSAWPAFLSGVQVPSPDKHRDKIAEHRHWFYARDFEQANRDRYPALFFWPRMTTALLSCLIVLIVYSWAGELCGPLPALAGAALYALNPDALAHGALVTTDVALTLTMLLALWRWQRFCHNPNLRDAFYVTLACGAAVLCKLTALFLWPMMAALAFPLLWKSEARVRRSAALAFTAAAIGAVFLTNVTYGFQGTLQTWGQQTFLSSALRGVQHAAPWLPTFVPHIFLEGVDGQLHQGENFVWAFLLGDQYLGHRWYYFPVALAFKLPVSILLLAVLGVWQLRSAASRILQDRVLVGVGLAAAMYLLLMIGFCPLDVGVRYLLPMYPLLFITLSSIWRRVEEGYPTWRPRIATALLAGAALETAWVAPQYLSFINLLGGGPSLGYRVLTDSNYDWGQDLLRLKHWMDENQIASVDLTYFGDVDPAVYGVHYTPGIEDAHEPLVVYSAFYVSGLAYGIPLADSRSGTVQMPLFRQLWRRTPVARPGYSLLVYRREDVMAAYQEYLIEKAAKPSR